jgi:PTH1 family peptidyl-tRNA hydrolase
LPVSAIRAANTNTRHNLGWVVLDAFAAKHGLAWKQAPQFEGEVARWDVPEPVIPAGLVKPLTFMNESGRSIGAMARFYKIEPAEWSPSTTTSHRPRPGQGPLPAAPAVTTVSPACSSISARVCRYRLGIGPKQPAQMDSDFVLGKFTSEQQTPS